MKKIICFMMAMLFAIPLSQSTAFAYATRIDDRFVNKRELRTKNSILVSDFAAGDNEVLAGYSINNGSGSLCLGSYTENDEDKTGLVLIDNDSSTNYSGPSISRNISKIAAGNILLEARFKMQNPGSKGYSSLGIILNGGSSQLTSFIVSSTGNLAFYKGDVITNVAGGVIKADEWYTLDVLVDLDNGKSQMLIKSESLPNGYAFFTDFDFRGTSPGYVDGIRIECRHFDGAYVFDYLKIERNVEALTEPEIEFVHPEPIPIPVTSTPVLHALDNRYNIKYNGEYVFATTEPFLDNGELYTTVKAAFNIFGVMVTFDKNQFCGRSEDKNVSGEITDDTALINVNEESRNFAVKQHNGKQVISINALADFLGKNIEYDVQNKTLSITD